MGDNDFVLNAVDSGSIPDILTPGYHQVSDPEDR